MWLSIESVKKKESDIVISAGNTGALLVIAKLNLKMIENIDDPLSALWQTKKVWCSFRSWANIECSSKNLLDFQLWVHHFISHFIQRKIQTLHY